MIDQARWLENNDKHLHTTVAWLRLRLEKLASSSTVETVKRQGLSEPTHSWFKWNKSDDTKLLTLQETASLDEKIERARKEINNYETDELSPALVFIS